MSISGHSNPILSSTRLFAAGCFVFAVMAFALTAMAPVGVSVIIVFLFAGPHNYVEMRYFLTRLPARMGRLKPFFITAAVGVIGLTVLFALPARMPRWFGWPPTSVLWLVGIWNTLFILWCTVLASMRSRIAPRRNWDYVWPVGIAAAGVTWFLPGLLPIVIVFIHPLMALGIIDREICLRRPEWSKHYRSFLWVIPIMLLLLWSVIPLGSAESRLVPESIQRQVSHHSGAYLFSDAVGLRLIATHAFLELLHYGIWILAIPLVSGRVLPMPFQGIPLMRRPGFVRSSIRIVLLAAAIVVGVLWFCFQADYTTTRDVYFTVAMLHVLAEIPFLLRML